MVAWSLGLFIVGALLCRVSHYAHGTVTWPILPAVFFGQVLARRFSTWRLAVMHMPLWVQLLPYLRFRVAGGRFELVYVEMVRTRGWAIFAR